MPNSGVSAVLTCIWNTRTASDVLNASSFQIVTEQHIPAMGHGEPIEAPPIGASPWRPTPEATFAVRIVTPWAGSVELPPKCRVVFVMRWSPEHLVQPSVALTHFLIASSGAQLLPGL